MKIVKSAEPLHRNPISTKEENGLGHALCDVAARVIKALKVCPRSKSTSFNSDLSNKVLSERRSVVRICSKSVSPNRQSKPTIHL